MASPPAPGLEVRRALVEAMRLLFERGLIPVRGGNASARLCLPDGTCFIYLTPRGKPKPLLKPEDIAVVSPDGYTYEGEPTSELKLHLAAYKELGVTAVVHAHNPLAVAATRLKLLNPEAGGVEAKYYLGGCISTVPYAEPGSEELAAKAVEALRSCPVAVLEEHGAVAVSSARNPVEAVWEAVDRLVVLEDVALQSLVDAAARLLVVAASRGTRLPH